MLIHYKFIVHFLYFEMNLGFKEKTNVKDIMEDAVIYACGGLLDTPVLVQLESDYKTMNMTVKKVGLIYLEHINHICSP